MRIRTVKPALFTSTIVSAWPRDVRWTLAGLYCYLDDAGRGVDEPRLVAAGLYPLDDTMTPKKVDQHLALMALAPGPLCRYQADDGSKLMHITEWTVKGSDYYQQINRASPSLLAPCPKHDEDRLFQ